MRRYYYYDTPDPDENPKWLKAVLLFSMVTTVVSFIIIAVMLLNFVHPGPVLTWTFWGSLALLVISGSIYKSDLGGGSDCDYAGDGSDGSGDGGDGGSCT